MSKYFTFDVKINEELERKTHQEKLLHRRRKMEREQKIRRRKATKKE